MTIAIVNQSTLVTGEQAQQMTAAVNEQANGDFCLAWARKPVSVTFCADASSVPAGADVITLVDTAQDAPAGVLGYHTEDGKGRWGIVAAKPELDNGAQVLTGDWAVSSVLSHEVLELIGDPSCSFWGGDGQGSMYCLEVCDPVEAPTYKVGGVAVSNFITPAWFDPEATSGFDHLGLLTAPFSILKGGYVVYAQAGHEQQKFGAEFPEWRRQMKQSATSRTRRRVAQVTA